MIKLGIVMDPIESINIKKDSSFAMMLEAQRRGYEIHYMEMHDLHLDQGVAVADTKVVELKEIQLAGFSLSQSKRLSCQSLMQF